MAPGTDAWAHGDGPRMAVAQGDGDGPRMAAGIARVWCMARNCVAARLASITYLPGAVDKAPVAKWVMDNLLVEHIDIDKYIHNGATELYVQRRARVASRVERRLARFAQANGPFAPADDLTDAL